MTLADLGPGSRTPPASILQTPGATKGEKYVQPTKLARAWAIDFLPRVQAVTFVILADVVDDGIHVDVAALPLGDLLATREETGLVKLRTRTLLPWSPTHIAKLSSTTAPGEWLVEEIHIGCLHLT